MLEFPTQDFWFLCAHAGKEEAWHTHAAHYQTNNVFHKCLYCCDCCTVWKETVQRNSGTNKASSRWRRQDWLTIANSAECVSPRLALWMPEIWKFPSLWLPSVHALSPSYTSTSMHSWKFSVVVKVSLFEQGTLVFLLIMVAICTFLASQNQAHR